LSAGTEGRAFQVAMPTHTYCTHMHAAKHHAARAKRVTISMSYDFKAVFKETITD